MYRSDDTSNVAKVLDNFNLVIACFYMNPVCLGIIWSTLGWNDIPIHGRKNEDNFFNTGQRLIYRNSYDRKFLNCNNLNDTVQISLSLIGLRCPHKANVLTNPQKRYGFDSIML